jgi:hypothetical protein
MIVGSLPLGRDDGEKFGDKPGIGVGPLHPERERLERAPGPEPP